MDNVDVHVVEAGSWYLNVVRDRLVVSGDLVALVRDTVAGPTHDVLAQAWPDELLLEQAKRYATTWMSWAMDHIERDSAEKLRQIRAYRASRDVAEEAGIIKVELLQVEGRVLDDLLQFIVLQLGLTYCGSV